MTSFLELEEPPLGTFELLLLRGKKELVTYLLHHIEVPDLFVLGKLNTRLRYWFDAYCRHTWDFAKFARLFTHRPRMFLSLFDSRHTVMYGEAVLRFFLREVSAASTLNLEMCSTVEKFPEIQRFLHDEGYMCLSLRSAVEYWPANVDVGDLVRRRHRKNTMTWGLDSDLSSTKEDLDGFRYSFGKGPTDRRRTIAVHIIRCEPHRHVLSRPNST